MSHITRRSFLKAATGASVLTGMGGFPYIARASGGKVVVIGGGAGGAIAAKYIKLADPSIDVTLIEANPNYHTCFLSNEVLSGERSIDSLKFGYEGLKKHSINIVIGEATAIDHDKKTVSVNASAIPFDRLVVSPGVDFRWETIAGYDASVAETIPHAWKAGPQTVTLRKQLEAMPDGGKVIIAAPPNPFRCPPGPYERAAQIAQYMKHHKPKSKIIILDAKDKFSKFGLFRAGWQKLYGFDPATNNGGFIQWVPLAQGGRVVGVNVKNNAVIAGDMEDEHKADVINIIPAQKAGKIASVADLTDDSGWCPINPATFESAKHAGVYVIGDSCAAKPLPKSAYAANSEAKVCAAAIVASLNGKDMVQPAYTNTCYSILGKDYGISVAAVYRLEAGAIKHVGGGLSPDDASDEDKKREVAYAHSWFNNITKDMFD